MPHDSSGQTPELAQRQCIPCRGGVPPLSPPKIHPLLEQLDGWQVVENHHLEKTYPTEDFAAALLLVNRIGALAEEQNHHPDLFLTWGRVVVKIWTHKIKGLSESDFILAAKIDASRAGSAV